MVLFFTNIGHIAMMDIFFRGEDGRIEGKYQQNSDIYAPTVLLLPPDPRKGADMQNKVLHAIFQTFANNGFSVLKINYRGVGRSDGTFSGGQGELEDATLAMNWLHRRNMNASNFWVVGFSFGAWIGAQLLMRRPEINGYVFVSPPTKEFSFNFLTPCAANGLILQADGDHLSEEEDIISLIDRLSLGRRGRRVDYNIVEHASHYFLEAEAVKMLVEHIDKYLKNNTESNNMSLNAIKKTRRRRKANRLPSIVNEGISYISPIKSINFD